VTHIEESYKLGMTYSLIFMDFSMPIMNGIDATKGIRDYLTYEFEIPREE
jgi:CheY-like chemotaxis protein